MCLASLSVVSLSPLVLPANMRLVDGGLAFFSARVTDPRAFLGSWALCLHSVAAELGCTSLESFRAKCPALWERMEQAESELTRIGYDGADPINWMSYFNESFPKLQGIIGKRVSTHQRKTLMSQSFPGGRRKTMMNGLSLSLLMLMIS